MHLSDRYQVLYTKGLDLSSTLIDVVRDACSLEQNTKEESSKTCTRYDNAWRLVRGFREVGCGGVHSEGSKGTVACRRGDKE